MFKRSKKLTSVMVALAAMVSLVPTSVNAAERLETKEGTIDKAIAFKDGKFIYKGYRTDDDDDAIYFNDGEKETQLEDVENSDIQFKYSDKYAYVVDSDDEYFIDLENGEVVDDEELADKAENVNSRLKTALKKADRYGKIKEVNLDENNILPSNNFSEVWYSYSAKPLENADGYEDIVDGYLYGFTNESAKYIDASKLANMYVYSSKRGKMVKVEKFNDEDSDSLVQVNLAKEPEFLTQDEDFIYLKTTVNVIDSNDGEGAKQDGERVYLQKISKAQGEQEDDAYLPKSVVSYEISDSYDCGDADDAYDVFNGSDKYSVSDIKFVSKKGTLYAVQVNSADNEDADEMRVTKFKMKKEKVNSDNSDISSKLDVQLLQKDDDEEQDIVRGFDSISIDVDGNIWALDKGKVIKFEDLKATELYTCDRSLTNIDVYDSENLIIWDGNDDGDVFTVLQDGAKAVDDGDSNSDNKEDEAIKSGWDKNSDGTWSYYAEGQIVKEQWIQDGNWYYLKEDGIMATGWIQLGGKWYYLNESGAMATGWLKDTDGNWYYLNPQTGEMATNTTIDGYVIGANGAWIK